MARFTFSLASAAAVLSVMTPMAYAQAAPNELAQYNPNNRTVSVNSTYCVLPIPSANVKALTGYNPLPIPDGVFPNGFPADQHPMLVSAGYEMDIRMTIAGLPLQIPALTSGSIGVPFTDYTGDGKTAIYVPVDSYVGGVDGMDLQALVPSLAAGVSPFEGTTTFPATVVPDTEAAQPLPGGYYSVEVKPYLLPNPLSGPGIYAEAFDMLFQLTNDSPYSAHTFHALINQPNLLNNNLLCQRNTVYFNSTFADPKMAIANVTLYHQILETPPGSIEGTYSNVYCYQANGQLVAGTGESCTAAAAEFDPKSQQ